MRASYLSSNEPVWTGRLSVCIALVTVLFGLLPFLLAAAAMGAPMTSGDPSLLTGPAPGPCGGATTGAEYIGGTDVYGHAVAPAAAPGVASVRLDSDTVYADVRTGRREHANVAIRVKGLANIMDAPTGCTAPH